MTTLASTTERRPVSGGVRARRRVPPLAADALALLALLLAAILGLGVAYARPATLSLGVAGRYNTPYLSGFHDPETVAGQQAPAYRWTDGESTILAPGLGRGVWSTTLELSSPQPQEPPKLVTVRGREQSWQLQLGARSRAYHLLTPAGGDLGVKLEAPARRYGADPRELGVVWSGAAFEPLAARVFPPFLLLLYTAIVLVTAYITLRLLGVPTLLALGEPLGAALLLAWAVGAHRAPAGLLLPRLAILAPVGLLSALALRRLWAALVRLGRLRPEPWLAPALGAVFVAGFAIKGAGLLWPYSHAIDVDWHVRDIMLVVAGRWRDFYLPGFFSYGKMPVAEWGTNPPLLPYTPFFHLVAAPLALLPWPLADSVNILSVIADTGRVVPIGALSLALGLRSRGALMAALLYAVTPFTFLLHSWGNIPTTFGMGVALLATTLLALSYGRWHERRVFVLLTAALLASFLFYFVLAVFSAVFVLLLAGALAFWRRGQPRQVAALLGSAALALMLSIAVYYIFFIPGMIERTLPYIMSTFSGSATGEGKTAPLPLAGYLLNHYRHMGYLDYPVRYGVWVPALLALPGLWLLRRDRFALVLLGSWLVVALLFFVVGLRMSMVDKYIFYAAPALAIGSAAVLERLWLRGWAPRIAVAALFVCSFASALDIWVLRLQRVA